jgi:type VI secretion system protein ImpK
MLILQLRIAKDLDDPDQLRVRIKELLSRLDANARSSGVEFEQVENARFALVAFIDEAITGVSFSQKDAWLASPLQMELFNRYDAGEEFFRRLHQLRQRAQANAGVLEVYYLCMLLGFKGKYQYDDPDGLRGVIEDTRNDLTRSRESRPAQRLSPHGKPQEGLLDVVSKEVPLWVIGVGAATIGFLIFLVFTVLMNNAVEEAVANIMLGR